jgi:PAS domain S-box-containing protein
MLATLVDITDRKRMEDALRESEENYRTLVESAEEAIGVVEPDGTILLLNSPAAARLGDEPPAQYVGLTIADVKAPEIAQQYMRVIRQVVDSSEGIEFERSERIEDRKHWYQVSVQPLRNSAGRVHAALVISREITERKQAEQDLLDYQEQLRHMAERLARVEEREREQLASYLHDAIGQTLALTRIKLGALRKTLEQTDYHQPVEQIRELVEQSIQATRSLTFELSPPVLHDLGLEAAVEWLAEDIEQRHSLEVSLETLGPPRKLDGDARTTLFGVVRELLINVVKHARADTATVRLDRSGQRLRIQVTDDGVGFDTEAAGPSPGVDSGGFGLFSLTERMRSLGGTFYVESRPGCGTTATVELPLEEIAEPQTTGEHQ